METPNNEKKKPTKRYIKVNKWEKNPRAMRKERKMIYRPKD